MGGRTSKKNVKITDEWDIGKQLGRGSFGIVRECTNKKSKFVAAVKIVQRRQLNKKEQNNLEREKEILSKAKHEYCVSLIQYYESKHKLYLVMELCEGGDLYDAITKEQCFTEEKAISIVRQMASALSYLHSLGIVHRDLKPENILFVDKEHTRIKLMDFGLSKILDPGDQSLQTRCGTLHYVAPEVLDGKKNGYTMGCDLWSVGVVVFVILCGYLPFYHDDRRTLIKLIMKSPVSFDDEEWKDISENAKDFIRRCLEREPEKRITSEGVLSHPWLGSIKEKSKTRFLGLQRSEQMIRTNNNRKKEKIDLLIARLKVSLQIRRFMQIAAGELGYTPVARKLRTYE